MDIKAALMEPKTWVTLGSVVLILILGLGPLMTGLDGGTYSVQFLPVSGFGYVDFESGVAETSAVLLNNGFLADAVKISFTNLGANKDPKACITFIRRSF